MGLRLETYSHLSALTSKGDAMSIADNCIQLENGSNLRSFINHATATLETLKSASEPIILVGKLSGEISETTDTYSDVMLTPDNTRSNFATDFVNIADNAIELTPDVSCAILLTSCEITFTGTTNLFERLSYQEIGSSEWKNYGLSLKRHVFNTSGHQAVHDMWLLTPSHPVYKYKLEITSDKSGTARDSRQNIFVLIAFTNSQRG